MSAGVEARLGKGAVDRTSERLGPQSRIGRLRRPPSTPAASSFPGKELPGFLQPRAVPALVPGTEKHQWRGATLPHFPGEGGLLTAVLLLQEHFAHVAGKHEAEQLGEEIIPQREEVFFLTPLLPHPPRIGREACLDLANYNKFKLNAYT